MAKRNLKKISRYGKLLLTAVALCIIPLFVPLSQIYEVLKGTRIDYLAVILLLAISIMVVQSIRWRSITILPKDELPSIFEYFQYIVIGYFTNFFLPSTMGGDAVKSVGLGRRIQDVPGSISAIMFARALGLASAINFFAVAYLIGNKALEPFPYLLWPMIGVGSFLSCCFALVYFKNSIQIPGSNILSLNLQKIFSALWLYRHRRKQVLSGIFWSFTLQICTLLMAWFTFLSVNMDMSLHTAFLFVPLIHITNMIPLTLFNIGVRESVYIFLFTSIAGITPEHCVAAAVVGYATSLAQALSGGVFMLIGNFFRKSSSPKQG